MAVYRIHRMKDHVRQQFRWAPHTIGLTTVRPKDYQQTGEIEADGHYAAWEALRSTDEPLQPGDVLESEGGVLRIYKYVGFEEAQWQVAEVRAAVETGAPSPDQPGGVA